MYRFRRVAREASEYCRELVEASGLKEITSETVKDQCKVVMDWTYQLAVDYVQLLVQGDTESRVAAALASPLVFCSVLQKTLSASVRTDIALAGNGNADDVQEGIELTIAVPLLLSIPFFNVAFLLVYSLLRTGYVVAYVVPALCTASLSSLVARVGCYAYVANGSHGLAPGFFSLTSNTLPMRLFKGACVADALLFLFSVYPAYHAFYDRAYRIAKRDLQREEEEDANTYTASW